MFWLRPYISSNSQGKENSKYRTQTRNLKILHFYPIFCAFGEVIAILLQEMPMFDWGVLKRGVL